MGDAGANRVHLGGGPCAAYDYLGQLALRFATLALNGVRTAGASARYQGAAEKGAHQTIDRHYYCLRYSLCSP